MKFVRRRFLRLAAGMAAMPALSRLARADDYPARSVRIVVGYAAGGVSDILARLIGQRLSERLGQPFVIENRPGAVSNVAAEVVVRAPPDGYTLFLAGISNAINVTLYPNLSFNFMRDMTPVGLISRSPLVMEVNPAVPAQSVAEFISYAKNDQNKVTMASAGAGGATHVSGELFQLMTGIKMLHVPYRGSPPALTDLMAGREQVMFDNLASSIALIRAGKLRALGLTSKTRSDALPDVPTIGEFVPGYEASIWNGITAPKNTPPEIIAKLNNELGAILAEPKIKAQYSDLGNTPVSSTPDEFAKLIADDTEKWAKVVKFADIKPE
jgi:tripartite-type tricarboxylate transporter receptor subunit TctC